jgi:anti-sigma-K factor RskA
MNTREDQIWKNLLSASASTFAGEASAPYGFITSTLTRMRAARQQAEFERVGWRALFASLATLVAVVTLTVGMHMQDRNDLDPGVSNIIEIQNVSVS